MFQYDISTEEFDLIAEYIYQEIGIHLPKHKITLVRSRLSKRLRHLGLNSFTEYYNYLLDERTGEELLMLTNEISTNVTSFFREPSQWEYLEEELLNVIDINKKEKKIRIWSSACSSGQEPYTIIMFLMNTLKNPLQWDIKILATDISEEILEKAQAGIYSSEDVKGLPINMINNFFLKEQIQTKEGKKIKYRIKENIKKYITFRKFNLVLGDYSFIKEGTFDWIFCRNVMIYFDKETKESVVLNLINKVKKEGHFLIGHSESLVTMNSKLINLIAPSIYKKK